MHELSIAASIVDIAIRTAGRRRVSAVEVRVGYLRQVVPDALTFAFALVAEGTPVEGAELRIETVPIAGRCGACGGEGEIEGFPLRCPQCGGLDVELTAGEELLVSALEVEQERGGVAV